MRTTRIIAVVSLGALALASASAQETAEVFQGEAAERFLREAVITDQREIGEGITRPERLTLELDGVTRYAVFKTIDMPPEPGGRVMRDGSIVANFQDTYQTEIAAYVIDRIIGLGMVPATVERRVKGVSGSVQWWVESAMSEADRIQDGIRPPDVDAWNDTVLKLRLFDTLIYNIDRHLNNILVTADFEIRLIDHSRTFPPFEELKNPERLTRFSRSLLDGLERLEYDDLKARLGRYLIDAQIRSVIARRDAILKLAQDRIDLIGERYVIYK